MNSKKVFIRDKKSSPPSLDQLEYLRDVKAEIMGKKQFESHRIAVQISDTAFVLCDPDEKENYQR